MKMTEQISDEEILTELGKRLTDDRLARNLTQAALAEEAGVSKRTVERLESGEVATQLSGFVRVCRALGLLERFDTLVPEATPGAMDQLNSQGRRRQRASRSKRAGTGTPKEWTWVSPRDGEGITVGTND